MNIIKLLFLFGLGVIWNLPPAPGYSQANWYFLFPFCLLLCFLDLSVKEDFTTVLRKTNKGEQLLISKYTWLAVQGVSYVSVESLNLAVSRCQSSVLTVCWLISSILRQTFVRTTLRHLQWWSRAFKNDLWIHNNTQVLFTVGYKTLLI